MAIQRALLLIADIGGYTRYMKVHRVNLSHAQDIVARLLEAVIDAAGPRFKLSKLEGDAALFYATNVDVGRFTDEIARIQKAFLGRRQQIVIDRLCNCDGCTQVDQLTLKFVAHLGEVAFQKVKSFTELAGLDVILVHRMLKNGVPLREYVLMTQPVLDGIEPAPGERARPLDEDYEGVGATRVHYLALDDLPPPATRRRSGLRAFWELVKMNFRSVPYILGFKKPCDGFRNLGDALSGVTAAAPAALPPASPPASKES